jgi:hypothetical protein
MPSAMTTVFFDIVLSTADIKAARDRFSSCASIRALKKMFRENEGYCNIQWI